VISGKPEMHVRMFDSASMNTNFISVARRPVRVIHLEDNPHDQELVEHVLLSTGVECEIVHADGRQSFQAAMAREANLIISDFSMPGYTGLKALEFARGTRPGIPFIFFSGTIGEQAAIESLKNGATDYVLKQQPERLETAIQRALTEARARADRLQAEEEAREQASRFYGGIAGDLNNILTPMMMAAEIMRNDPGNKYSSHLLKAIETGTRRGADLVEQLHSAAMEPAGDGTPVHLQLIAWEIWKRISETFPPSIAIAMDVPNDLPAVMGDSARLNQVLLNLCINARDAMLPRGGVLSISAAAVHLADRKMSMRAEPVSGEFVELKVSDTGAGIPRAMQAKIFEPFFTTKKPGHGTGLGLSTVLNIVNAQGGCLDISSQPGKWTTFSLYFPVAKETVAVHAEALEAAPLAGLED